MTMRRSYWALLLPLLLLFAQQGEMRHEYAHDVKAAASCVKAPASPDHCPLCLAYAHLAGAAKTDVISTDLLSHLSFHHDAIARLSSVDADGFAPRSRGPPINL